MILARIAIAGLAILLLLIFPTIFQSIRYFWKTDRYTAFVLAFGAALLLLVIAGMMQSVFGGRL